MKKFILKSLLFFLPVVVLAYGVDQGISHVLKKSKQFADGEYPTWNTIYDGTVDSKVVVYGSSRALFHISPMIIADSLHTTSYNLGINGHTFLLQYLRHQELLAHNPRPDLIILTMDISTLVKGKNLYNPDQFLPYMLYNKRMEDVTLKFNGYDPVDYQLPLIRYYGKKEAIVEVIKLLLNPSSNTPWRTRGYRGNEKQWTDDLKKAKSELGVFEAVVDSNLVRQFEIFLGECIKEKQKLVLVYTPEYIEGQQFEVNRKEVVDLYTSLAKKYNVPFIDYSADSISYQKKYFYNSGHLNKTGSELFTNKLVDDIRRNNLY